jgi:adenosine deaminase
MGLLTVAHAGEEGSAEYIWQALEILHAARIDHGVRCLDDERLVARLASEQTTLTVCPLSNVKLHVFASLAMSNVPALLDHGLRVTINSDDPAYFSGYIADNVLAVAEEFRLTDSQIIQLARNSILGSFLSQQEKEALMKRIDALVFNTVAVPRSEQ